MIIIEETGCKITTNSTYKSIRHKQISTYSIQQLTYMLKDRLTLANDRNQIMTAITMTLTLGKSAEIVYFFISSDIFLFSSSLHYFSASSFQKTTDLTYFFFFFGIFFLIVFFWLLYLFYLFFSAHR